jgi:hypothetical protein
VYQADSRIGVTELHVAVRAVKKYPALRDSALVLAAAMLLSLAGNASAGEKPSRGNTLDFEPFITDHDLWHLKPEQLVERSH